MIRNPFQQAVNEAIEEAAENKKLIDEETERIISSALSKDIDPKILLGKSNYIVILDDCARI